MPEPTKDKPTAKPEAPAPVEAAKQPEVDKTGSAPVEPEVVELPVYQTERFIALGIPYCQTCGEQFRTGMHGERLCPIAKADCDRHGA
ncbi:MAG: hypothetical protein KME43_16415 [Myxacorys chilensis ATA2-1-KO14]|jgi:hypothetical protein|nr:hypothetical protein [Myxacorys chilensis ATA2-1-KO14]